MCRGVRPGRSRRCRTPDVLPSPSRLEQVPVLPRAPHRPGRGHLEHVYPRPTGPAPFGVHPRRGTGPAVDSFENLLRPLCSELGFGVSRLDLYVDVQGFALDADDRERYVCRAGSRRTYEQSERCSGFEFGAVGEAPSPGASTTRPSTPPPRAVTGGWRSGVTVIVRAPTSPGLRSSSAARPSPSSASTHPLKCSPQPATFGPTAPSSG